MFDGKGNGDGKTQKLERQMSLMGINPTKRELGQMAKDVDKDGKGIFNCDRFLGLMALYTMKGPRTRMLSSELLSKCLIKRPRDTLTGTHSREALNEIEVEQMMKKADKDRDGTIDYEEFVAMMTEHSFKMS